MSEAIVIDGEEIWSPSDEEWLQERMDERQQEETEADVRRCFRHLLRERCGQQVSLLVDHPYKDLPWVITCELGDARGFYRCVCDNGYECVFYETDLTTDRNL